MYIYIYIYLFTYIHHTHPHATQASVTARCNFSRTQLMHVLQYLMLAFLAQALARQPWSLSVFLFLALFCTFSKPWRLVSKPPLKMQATGPRSDVKWVTCGSLWTRLASGIATGVAWAFPHITLTRWHGIAWRIKRSWSATVAFEGQLLEHCF